MPAAFHRAFYQGVACKAAKYRRSPGFQPERGTVDIDVSLIKKIQIRGRGIPWRAVNGSGVYGGMDIRTQQILERSGVGITVVSPPEIKAPEEGGFELFGDLVLESLVFPNGALIDRIRYRDIHVDSAGLEEVTRDLANVQAHNTGTIRVPLTDIRRWYKNHGPFFDRINWKLRSGDFDKTTLKDGEDTPYSFIEVLEQMFKLLPGSPLIVSRAEVRGLTLSEPLQIYGEGEPVVQHIERLLDRNGLDAGMLPNGNWTVYRRLSSKFKQNQVPGPNGAVRAAQPFQHYERRTTFVGDRPPAVLAVGKKKIRRKTQSYVPVLQDVDGRWYKLNDLMRIWGYDIAKVNKGAITGHEKYFQDVLPKPVNGNDARLHEARKRILSRAYRIYAPRAVFSEPDLSGSSIDDTTRQRVSLKDEDFERNAYLPLRECAWFLEELERLQLNPAGAEVEAEFPRDKIKSKGDKDFFLAAPLVRANRIGQQLYLTATGTTPTYEEFFKAQTDEHDKFIRRYELLIEDLQRDVRNKADALNNTQAAFVSTFDSAKIARSWLAQRGVSTRLIKLNSDVTLAAKEAGAYPPILLAEGLQSSESLALKRELEIDALILKDWQKVISDAKAKRAVWDANFKAFDDVYKKRGSVRCWYNVPHGQLEDGVATINPRTGILTASEPLVHIDKPFFFDGDESVVQTDGAVTVTAGYELNENTIKAFTTFLFVSSEPEADDAIAEPLFAGVCRSSPIKAYIVNMGARIYEMDEGTPANLNSAFAEAFSKAAEKLAVPRAIVGFTYEYLGLRNFPLDAGVSSVQHTWNGSRAQTHISINAPGARGPLGPGNLAKQKGPGQTVHFDRLDDRERHREHR